MAGPRTVDGADLPKPRKGERATKPLGQRYASEAIRGGIIEELEKVETLPVPVERPFPLPVEVAPLPVLASAEQGQNVKVSPTVEIVALIKEIAAGRYTGDTPARDVIAAARLLCDFGVSKPTASVDVRQAVVYVMDPFDGADEEPSAREPIPFTTAADFK